MATEWIEVPELTNIEAAIADVAQAIAFIVQT